MAVLHVPLLCRICHRFVNAVLDTASCCAGPGRQQQALGAARSSSSSSCTTYPSGGLSSTLHPAHLDSFLTAVKCEAQMMKLLLEGQAHNSRTCLSAPSSSNGVTPEAAASCLREKHLLDAVVSCCWCCLNAQSPPANL